MFNRRNNFFILGLLVISLFITACGSKDLEKDKISDKETELTTSEESLDVNIASLKGPTSIGLIKMIEDNKEDTEGINYNFNIYSMADEVVTGLAKGEIDIAAIPANLASTLYNKTEGQIQVSTLNTLGVLYMVENDNKIDEISDLENKTIYTIGKGTTPEGVISSFISKNKLENVRVEYKAEASEIAALLKGDEHIIAMIPQPFVAVVENSNEKVRTIFDMNEEWMKVNNGSPIVTGVLVARKDFIKNNKEVFDNFLEEYKESVEYVKSNTKEAAKLVEDLGIIPPATGEASIPKTNIDFIVGEEMKLSLSNYLKELYEFNENLVGGSLPDEGFYYEK